MRPVVPILLAIAIAGSSACSIKKMAANTIASTLADTGTTFTGDEDVQLVGDALPFALKLYESTLASTPNHQALLLATCSAFTQYAYAYIETAAEALPSSRRAEIQAARDRALRLYLRARGYCFRGLDARFGAKTSAALIQDPQSVVARARAADVPLLYWTAASWGLAISLGIDQPELAVDLPNVRVLADRALALDEKWSKGAIHELFITLDSLPEALGGNPARAKEHFDKAVELQQGLSPGPYVSLATGVVVSSQDRAEFERLLKTALSIDPEKDPPNRLITLVTQQRARVLLDRIDERFSN
ncbi:MAG TPA: TRAP transporter TatT component family protein [Vicinamibacterales bacterium]|jgi:predicted anti-sigma-YlaC factor YlaD|nr:TRAP transporter TatT component family protein [Vicinamibacterales bacterium]